MTPDYAPQMLQAFLQARATMRRCTDQSTNRDARNAVRAEIMAKTGLCEKDLHAAFRAGLRDGVKRARIWSALGVYPEEFGVLLLDNGGQE